MKRILSLLIISAPLFAAQQPNKPNQEALNQRLSRDAKIAGAGYGAYGLYNILSIPPVRDALISGAIAVAPAAPILVPLTAVAAIGMRIAMSDDQSKNK